MEDSAEAIKREAKAELELVQTDIISKLDGIKQELTATDNDQQRLIEVSVRLLRSDVDHINLQLGNSVSKEEYAATAQRLESTKLNLEGELDLMQSQIRQ